MARRRGFSRLLTAADLAAIVLYLVGITAVGLRFYHRDTGLKEFLLGTRSMGWLPVALSILAADTSAITYLGQPAWVFAHDMKLNQMILGYLVAIPTLILVFLPAYSRQQLYTAYQFLENRFGLSVRLLTSALFLFLRGSHAAIVIYVPALILADLMGVRLAVTVLCVGLLTTFYTMLGGIKAAIWTDTIQVCTVLAGFTAIALTAIHGIPGGLRQAFGTAIEHGKLRLFDWSTNFNNVDNSWAILVGGSIIFVQTMAADQAVLQKYLTTRSYRETVKSLLCYGVAVISISTLLSLLGVVLFAFYTAHPTALKGLAHPDALVPRYVATSLPHGFAGLVVASLFAGSMSTVSASLNALATSSVVDIYKRTLRRDKSEAHYTFASRVATGAWGIAATTGALFAWRLGPLVTAFPKFQTELAGLLLGIFVLAVGSQRVTGTSVIIGATIGLAAVVTASAYSSISLFFLPVIGGAITIATGYLTQLFFAPRRAPSLT